MLKREITSNDLLTDTEVTEIHYFNLTKSELLELEAGQNGGLQRAIEFLVENNDQDGIISQLKKIILMSYGRVSEDGKRFQKSELISADFLASPAYDSLFIELIQDPNKLVDFIVGILPKALVDEIKAQDASAIPSTPPASFAPPTVVHGPSV